MPRLLATALSLRRDPRVLKAPPYVSFLCILVGFVWLLLLPLDEYSRRTYISENALLPGQVHTYFGGSEHNVLRAYRAELDQVTQQSNVQINDRLETIFKDIGVKVGRQNYTYHSAGRRIDGENVYGILQAPRGDATEAIVLVAAWKNVDAIVNRNGVALALTLARYFKRWSLWSKDIIIVIPPDSKTGMQAWVDAYHDAHDSSRVAPLPLKSGALQGAIAIDYPFEHRFDSMHIEYDGTNGQLPNLDLINSIVNIAGGQMGIQTTIQGINGHSNNYQHRLETILRGMLRQGLGYSTGPHSCFIPYHVDAVTLQPQGEGWHDEMAMGRVVEGTFRSLNNLLEHLHQSFFFYLLMHKDRFVSIGTYLPSAMLLAANFSIMAIFLWVKSGQSPKSSQEAEKKSATRSKPAGTSVSGAVVTAERDLFLPCAALTLCHGLSVVPLYTFNNLPAKTLAPAFLAFSIGSALLPVVISHALSWHNPTPQQYQLIKSFSLLFLGMTLATLATLNFSLAFLVGLACAPFSFVQSSSRPSVRWLLAGLLSLSSPTTLLHIVSNATKLSLEYILTEASFGWDVWGMYTPVVVWCVWWPAWLVAMVVVLAPVSA